MNGTILNIQKFCTKDGPGIRTTVFLKGCPLRCKWCHNPESQKTRAELLYDAEKCVGCGRCAEVCETGAQKFRNGHILDRSRCVGCFRCVGIGCGALERAGKDVSVDDVIQDVADDAVFYESSGGGLTLSGGEPFSQPEFTLSLLGAAKSIGLHTCVETCGYFSENIIEKATDVVDIFLYDIKLTNDELHKKYTGVSNRLISENLRHLDSLGAKTILHCPIIPGINDTAEHLAGIASAANSLKNIIEINIEPFNQLSGAKYGRLGLAYQLDGLKAQSRGNIETIVRKLSGLTDVNVIVI